MALLPTRPKAPEIISTPPPPTGVLPSGTTEAEYDALLKTIGSKSPAEKAALYKRMRDDGFTDAVIRKKVESSGVKQLDQDWIDLQRLAGFTPSDQAADTSPAAPAPAPALAARNVQVEQPNLRLAGSDRLQIQEDTGVDPLTLNAVNSAGGDVELELARLEREAAAEQKRLEDEAAAAQKRADEEAAAAEAERQRLFDEEQARLNAAAAAEAARKQAAIDAEILAGKTKLDTDLATARAEMEAMKKREADALAKLKADEQARLDAVARSQAEELMRLQIQRDQEQAAFDQQISSQKEEQARIAADLQARQAEAAAAAERSARELDAQRAANELSLRNRRDEMQRTSAMRQVAAARAGRSAGARPLLVGADIGQATGAQTLGTAGSFANAGSLGIAGTLGAAGGLR